MVWYIQREGERLVICNNYIKKVVLVDLKWNKHDCLMHLHVMFPILPNVLKRSFFWDLIITYFILVPAYEIFKLCLRRASSCVFAEEPLYANICGTYHGNGHFINRCSWILTDTMPNLSVSDVASKLCPDLLVKWGPEELSKEEIEGTNSEK